MFTKKTLLTFRLLHDLVYKAEALDGSSNLFAFDSDGLLSAETADDAICSTHQTREKMYAALVEVLQNAAPQFADTPFAATMTEIIAGLKSGSSNAQLHASVELSKLDRAASDWLAEKERAVLPVLTFRVASWFGEFVVEATDGNRARVKAAEQYYGKSMEELDPSLLRHFAVGFSDADFNSALGKRR